MIPMLNALVATCDGEEESLTWTVNEATPDCVGVPAIWPVAAVSVRPAGRDPLVTDQEYGVVPPVAAKEALYAAPTCPPLSELVVTLTGLGAELTVNVTLTAALWIGEAES